MNRRDVPLVRSPLFAQVLSVTLLHFITLWGAPSAAEPRPSPWSRAFPAVVRDVRAGKPLVIHVVVPLCANAQIACGSRSLGNPMDLRGNLYWGALFGNRRFFDEDPRFAAVSLRRDVPGVLQRAVYRRRVSDKPWGGSGQMEQIVVLDAVHGSYINDAVESFWRSATGGAVIEIVDGERTRRLAVHVTGYAGHNRLMDGIRLSEVTAPRLLRSPTPSFVLACFSDKYFSEALRRAGSQPLVMTSSYVAPEGYATVALVAALGDNLPLSEVRRAVVRAYAKHQRITPSHAGRYFSPSP